MAENETPETPAPDTAPVADAATPTSAPPAWKARLKKWSIIGGVSAVVIPILGLALWTAVALKWSYSTGYRAGYVQKLSKKGWICPTWEGEIQMVNLPGASPERWSFTVRDDIVAAAVQSSIGSSVALEYEEHRGVPTSCFGDTKYFVVGVKKIAAP
jgi:hypothetical protein